jgi:DNA-binding CsgD family transcriptional regulator
VRAQLNSVFAKLGVRRQAQVAGALATLPSFEPMPPA